MIIGSRRAVFVRFLCACAAIACCGVVHATTVQPAPARLQRVGREAGLTPEMITAIYQDRAGFIWVGTRQGLFLWDGVNFRRFEHRIYDPASIGDDAIRTVFEDSAGRLWIGTNSAGLDLLDRATWRCTHFRHDPKDEHSLGYDSVNAIAEEKDGTLWVATQKGLDRFDPTTRRFVHLEPDGRRGPRGSYVFALNVASDGALWAGTVNGGLDVRDPVRGEFRAFVAGPEDRAHPTAVYAITTDGAGRTWLGTEDGLCLAASATAWECVPLPVVTSIARGEADHLWVGTLGGLYDVDVNARAVTASIELEAGTPRTTHGVRVVSLLRDRSGTLWVGTWEDGLQRLREPGAFYSTVLPAGDTTAVLEDRSGRVWATTSAGQLYRRDPGGAFTLVPRADGSPRGPILLRVLEDARGHLWIGSAAGLADYDPQTGKVVEYTHGADPGSLGDGYVSALARDRDGALWVGTGEGGLQRLRDDGRFDHFRHDPARADSLSDDYVTAILEDRRGRLFVGTRSGGLNVFDSTRSAFHRFAIDASAPGALGHHNVTALLEDRAGTVWIATGGGVYRLVEVPGEPPAFARITAREGLPDDAVVSLAEDGDTLWIATRGGLARYDPRAGAFRDCVPGDAQSSTEFNASAVHVAADRIYFGTVRGLVAVPRGYPFRASGASPVVVTAIRTLAGPVEVARPVWSLDDVSIRHGEALFVEFAVLDYTGPSRQQFAYRLDGSAAVDLGPSRIISFGKLEPGEHVFVVTGRNAAGIWNEARPLRIRVVPPYWMTSWFRGLVFALVAALALAGHRYRTAGLERRNRALELLQEQRERALAESRAKEEQLRAAYAGLRQLTRRFENAKEEERKRIALELHDELGQAITAAKIALDMAARESASGSAGETAQLLQRIIERVRDLSLDLRPPLLDERGLVPALRAYVEAQARRSGLAIEIEVDAALGRFAREIEMTAFRIAQEGVTNALRHAEAGWIFVRVSRTAGGLEVVVRDDGRGFEVGETLVRAEAGSHLGLLGMRERVEALAGTLAFDSRPGHGTEIRASLPGEVPP